MKTLLFGCDGQVGVALQNSVGNSTQLIALNRSDCDLADLEHIARVIHASRPDLVINAAAYTAVDRAENEKELAAQVNSIAAGAIAEACRSSGARVIHISTDFVFDGLMSRPYRVDDHTNPVNVYGRTKLDGENAIAGKADDYLIIRTSWVYGAHGSNFMNSMLRLMRQRTELSVVADQIGTPTNSRSLANAIWRLAASGQTGICHYSDAGVASWYDFAVAIAEEACAVGLLDAQAIVNPIDTSQYPVTAKRPSYSVLDSSSSWQALGGAAPHWRVNLRKSIRELRDNA